MEDISKIESRLFQIKIELVHEDYLDGWDIKRLKEEKEILENKLISLTDDKNR